MHIVKKEKRGELVMQYQSDPRYRLVDLLGSRHTILIFELLTYGLEGGPMEPEVILHTGECGYDELGPFYGEYPVIVGIDFARMESRTLAHLQSVPRDRSMQTATFAELYGGDHVSAFGDRYPRRKARAMNIAIQSQAAMLEMDHLRNTFCIQRLPDIPDTPAFDKDYKPRRRGQKRDSSFFGRKKK